MSGVTVPQAGIRLRALIVDDEAPARQELRYLLAGRDDVEVVGEAATAAEALQLAASLPYAVVFVDVRMPDISGLELAQALHTLPEGQRPHVVVVTAYEEYAVEAFAIGIADYLLKPVSPERLELALERVKRRVFRHPGPVPGGKAAGVPWGHTDSPPAPRRGAGGTAGTTGPFPPATAASFPDAYPGDVHVRIPVHTAFKTLLLPPADVYYIAAVHGSLRVKTYEREFQARGTLKEMERRLRGRGFFRAHRHYLVNLERVSELIPDFKGAFELVLTDRQGTRIPVSRRRAHHLRRLLVL